MSDRFFTFMVVPERGSHVRKFTLPTLYLRGAAMLMAVFALIGVFVFYDYLHVMSQVAENKKLRRENHDLQRDVQKAKSQLEALDQSVGRLKSFAQKLRVLGNLDHPSSMKFMEAPDEPGTGKRSFEMNQEDSGNIRDPGEEDKPLPKGKQMKSKENPDEALHAPADAKLNTRAELEASRSLSVLDKNEYNLEAAALVEQINNISAATQRLNGIAQLEEQRFADLYEHFQDRAVILRATPSTLPAEGWLSSPFGYRSNPFVGAKTFHAGIDIANREGTFIRAPADGLVTYASTQGGFGKVIRIDHGYGIVTKYGHTAQILVRSGERVKRGQKIAMMGSSGRSTGPHLHYQVEVKGKPVNPRSFILEDDF